jgi:hypothetical protein
MIGWTEGGSASSCRHALSLRELRQSTYLIHSRSSTMTDTTVTEEQKPQNVDDNEAEDSDDGVPEIAATDGQFHLSLSNALFLMNS